MDSNPIALSDHKPHAVCVPFPAQGHINPMLNVAKLLHSKGFHITFVNTEYIHNRILISNPNSLNGLPDFCFRSISNGLEPTDDQANQDIYKICDSLSNKCLIPFRELLHKLNHTSACSKVPPVSCIVSDGGMTFTLDAAYEFGVPGVLFWTSSGNGVLGYTYYRQLVQRGFVPLKDASYLTNGYLETIIDWIPGMKNIRLKDLPTFFRITDPNDLYFNWILREVDRASRASAIIMNTYHSLEQDAIDALCQVYPRLYTIGPLQLFVDQIKDDELKHIDSSLWKEEAGCMEWLDSKEPNSVLFVNFGTTTDVKPEELVEFAWGLANSKKPFLWIIRSDISAEFKTDTKDRGMIMSWCPSQEKILKHPSIGGFLSHMGWNSTIESLCAGVPMICWPNFADQTTVCKYACNEWGIGMEMDKNVKREVVEKLVREVLDGEKGKGMKKKAMEWKKKANESISPAGSSYLNLEKLLDVLLGNKN